MATRPASLELPTPTTAATPDRRRILLAVVIGSGIVFLDGTVVPSVTARLTREPLPGSLSVRRGPNPDFVTRCVHEEIGSGSHTSHARGPRPASHVLGPRPASHVRGPRPGERPRVGSTLV